MKILVIGAGVLGSLYAARLAEIGIDVTILARNSRFTELTNQGIILEHAIKGNRTITYLPIIQSLESDDAYDLIIILVRRDQVEGLLPILSVNKRSKLFLFMVNNPTGYADWINAVGKERLLLGFAGAGGTRKDGVVYYHIVSPILQPTTLAELDGRISIRIKSIARIFRKAGFPTVISRNMDAWQKTHVAWVSPVANAIYAAGGDGKKLSQNPEVLHKLVMAIHEAFSVLNKLKTPITPAKLHCITYFPVPLVVKILQLWSKTKHFDTIATRHSVAAYDEIRMLSNDLQGLARSTGIATPSLDCLHQAMLEKASKYQMEQ